MAAVHRIIARQSVHAGGLCVVAELEELLFTDGHAVRLHFVHANGGPMRALRALRGPGGKLVLFDLGRIVRRLAGPLQACPDAGVAGLVFYTLRQVYPSASLFVAAVERHASGTWWSVGPDGQDGYSWAPAAHPVDAEWLAGAAAATLPAQQPAGQPPAKLSAPEPVRYWMAA